MRFLCVTAQHREVRGAIAGGELETLGLALDNIRQSNVFCQFPPPTQITRNCMEQLSLVRLIGIGVRSAFAMEWRYV